MDVGQSPPLDLVSAQAEVAANQEQLIIAETAVRQAEDRLRLLIFDATDRDVWNVALEAGRLAAGRHDRRSTSTRRSTNALRDRADLTRAPHRTSRTPTAGRQVRRQPAAARRPAERHLSGQRSRRHRGPAHRRLPGHDRRSGRRSPAFGTVLDQLLPQRLPDVGGRRERRRIRSARASQDATYARARLERAQAETRVKSAEARVIQQVRDAAWKVEMNAKRIETSRAARELAEQRLDAERKRFEVGMSTSFLVIQAQRDLAQARTNELSAILAYDLSLVDFEALQQAGPAGQPTAQLATTSQRQRRRRLDDGRGSDQRGGSPSQTF